ncbi:MAG: GNAT family N-acetyltransferase [Planctomycetes bacterium]|nr:GNAT family N-acetyltransferase [Planctomycetota bacterium]
MSVRPATLAELDLLAALDHRTFGAHAYPRVFFRQAYDLWGRWLLVACDDEASSRPVLGSLVGAPALTAGDAWILSLAVDAPARGRGVGARLLAHALGLFASDGVRRALLTVAPDNAAALALYERAGFVVAARDDDAFGPGETRLRMVRALA